MHRLVCLVGVLVLGNGCASSTAPRLSYEGHSNILATGPTVVDAVVTVRNTGSAPASIPVHPCSPTISAFSTPDRNDEPLWTSGPEACTALLIALPPIIIAPGDFYDFSVRATLPASLSGQRVYLTMSVPNVSPVPVGQVAVK